MPQAFKKKFARRKQRWTTKIPFHALDLRNNGYLALVKTKTKTDARNAYWTVNTGSLKFMKLEMCFSDKRE